MSEQESARRRVSHPWQVAAVIAGAAIASLFVAIAAVVPLTSETARVHLIRKLAERLDGEVELRELHLRVFPKLAAEGRGLVIRHRGRRDVPPLISVERFVAEGSIARLLHRHVSRVELEGLDIQIPPDRNRDPGQRDDGTRDNDRGPVDQEQDAQQKGDQKKDASRSLVIDELHSVKARLSIIPREAGKSPKVWDIHDLSMRSVSADTAMPFEATLTNAIPPGEIVTHGSFGPWHAAEPGGTPLDGIFNFDRADLSVFKGISGILSAHGSFGGALERIDVHGETDTPLFTVAVSGHPVPLHAKYHAIVDGTNGNTLLERIDASFFKTAIVAKGGVVGTKGKDGRTTTLDVTIDKGRLEDVLTLAVKTPKAPMSGALRLATKLVLPPGDIDVIKKLRLDGRFAIADGRFTNPEVQSKINELSQRTRVSKEPPKRIASQFTGTFRLGSGSLAIPVVTFDVPGAAVRLTGNYDLVPPEELNFRGTLFTDAKISQMVTGFKSVLLRVFDPLFKGPDGGSAIPIRISGTRNNPSFGLDKGRVFKKKDSKDGPIAQATPAP